MLKHQTMSDQIEWSINFYIIKSLDYRHEHPQQRHTAGIDYVRLPQKKKEVYAWKNPQQEQKSR